MRAPAHTCTSMCVCLSIPCDGSAPFFHSCFHLCASSFKRFSLFFSLLFFSHLPPVTDNDFDPCPPPSLSVHHQAGPEPVVKTLKGCRCALPYKLSPHGTGMRNIVEATCNRFEPSEYGVTPYYWCPTVGDCGDVLDEPVDGHTHFDKCIGEEPGFLEPEPTMTEQGCHCILPFLFEPKSFRNMDNKMMVYTECTDTGAVADQSAWCAVKGHCGRRSRRSKAHKEEGGYGWTHWDFCKKQPEVRGLLPSGQPKLPSPAPLVRTKNGCSCKLPFPYAPAKDCEVEKETDGCEARGGYMMSGFCVVCKVLPPLVQSFFLSQPS
jgi:hypothetical protein